MVTFKGITLHLRSQHDITSVLPEYAPNQLSASQGQATDGNSALTTVFVPIYPGTQFWICYNARPDPQETNHFFYKLFLEGKHIVSWGSDAAHDYKGYVEYGIFSRWQKKQENCVWEKRAFFFPSSSECDGSYMSIMEIRVYRSSARRRSSLHPALDCKSPGLKKFDQSIVQLRNIGTLDEESAHKFYDYALLDRIDQPFATFRYMLSTWENIVALDLNSNEITNHVQEVCEDFSFMNEIIHNHEEAATNQGAPEPRISLNKSDKNETECKINAHVKQQNQREKKLRKKWKWLSFVSSRASKDFEDLITSQ